MVDCIVLQWMRNDDDGCGEAACDENNAGEDEQDVEDHQIGLIYCIVSVSNSRHCHDCKIDDVEYRPILTVAAIRSLRRYQHRAGNAYCQRERQEQPKALLQELYSKVTDRLARSINHLHKGLT